jgi:hypothetical protein
MWKTTGTEKFLEGKFDVHGNGGRLLRVVGVPAGDTEQPPGRVWNSRADLSDLRHALVSSLGTSHVENMDGPRIGKCTRSGTGSFSGRERSGLMAEASFC